MLNKDYRWQELVLAQLTGLEGQGSVSRVKHPHTGLVGDRPGSAGFLGLGCSCRSGAAVLVDVGAGGGIYTAGPSSGIFP